LVAMGVPYSGRPTSSPTATRKKAQGDNFHLVFSGPASRKRNLTQIRVDPAGSISSRSPREPPAIPTARVAEGGFRGWARPSDCRLPRKRNSTITWPSSQRRLSRRNQFLPQQREELGNHAAAGWRKDHGSRSLHRRRARRCDSPWRGGDGRELTQRRAASSRIYEALCSSKPATGCSRKSRRRPMRRLSSS
jgi:hypothetical protein